jgi:hypothetical protein
MIKSIFYIPGNQRKDENGKIVGTEGFDLPIIELPMRLVIGDAVNLDGMFEANNRYEGILTEEQKDMFYEIDSPKVWWTELKTANNEYVMYYRLDEGG